MLSGVNQNENFFPIENALLKSEEDEQLDFPFDYSKATDEVYHWLQYVVKDMKLRCKFQASDERKIFAQMVKVAYNFEVNLFVNKWHMCLLPRDKVEDVFSKCGFQRCQYWKEYLIIPSKTRDKNSTKWKQFWSIFTKIVDKDPGSYSIFHQFAKQLAIYFINSTCTPTKLVASANNQISNQ
ncbi:unnamed protein product [Ambrosiozyma monospora]|uniref:Unnamed protein product n=1 Tax=Ambrosiozyma monospora TaxID=43982 RepID=A0A9W6YU43_AMBMO|nr:unnamed protein product [Ambrosiozyma monospora]